MAIDFPNSPSNGDSFTSNDKTWQYNGTSWVVIAGSVSIDAGSVTASKLASNAVTTAKIADSNITTAKIAAGAVTAAKLGNDIQLTPPDGSITAAKIASDAVTTAKILDANVTTAKVAANAITQAKLAANVSAVTVTTTANRGTDVPSPFTGQLVYLSDVTRLQVWDGSAWMFITNGAPGAPTSLSATVLSTTSVSVAFTTGTINGASPTNYKYSLSTNGGSTYDEPTALDPLDVISPVTISGLTTGQTYHIKLRAVSDFGDSPDSTAASFLMATTPDAPTSLSVSNITLTTANISFVAGSDNGSAITNHQYALSTNDGSTYGSFTALDPADATSPITISGLSGNSYLAKLKSVNAVGAGSESSAVSFVVPNGLTEATAGTSAYQLKTLYPAYTTGYFWIKPTGGAVARQVWCDMSNLGGGWMLMSYCGTDVSTGTHVKDAYTGSAFNASSSTVVASNGGSGTAGNLGQSFIDSCVVAARSRGVALFRIDNINWYFPTTSTSNWLVLVQRSRADHANLSTFDTTNMARTGNDWLKSCYPTYTADSGNNSAGTVSGAIVQMEDARWNTLPGNMANGSATNWGYSISPYYQQTSEAQQETHYSTWKSSHSGGWIKSGYFWLKIGAE